MVPEALIPLGKLVNVHATRGELRMLPFNPDSETLTAGATVILRRGAWHEPRCIRSLRRHKHFLLLTLDGCDSMTAAEQLVGCEVCVHQHDLPPTGPDEIYHFELIGMTVLTTAGTVVGIVEEVLEASSHSICVVRAGKTEHLIPFVADVVKEIDRTAQRVIIDPPPGLLDA